MKYRRAALDDFPKIVELQNKNLISVVSPDNRANGFLATAYTADHFKQMNAEVAVVLAEDDAGLCGYLGASSVEFYRQFPIAAEMLRRLSFITYQGETLDLSRIIITNPVCIAAAHRGHGVYPGLCRVLFPLLPAQSQFALTLVPVENQRSFVSTSKYGFEIIDEFAVNGMRFHSLIVRMSQITL